MIIIIKSSSQTKIVVAISSISLHFRTVFKASNFASNFAKQVLFN